MMEILDSLNDLEAQTYRFEEFDTELPAETPKDENTPSAAALRLYIDDRRTSASLPIEWWNKKLDYEKYSMPDDDRQAMREWIKKEKQKMLI